MTVAGETKSEVKRNKVKKELVIKGKRLASAWRPSYVDNIKM